MIGPGKGLLLGCVMDFGDEFRKAVEVALGGRAATRVAVEAGLPRRSIATILEKHDPGLSRAAEVAQALGLELCVRRKGAPLDEWSFKTAAHAAFAAQLSRFDFEGASEKDVVNTLRFAARLLRTLPAIYAGVSESFSPAECADPDVAYASAFRSMNHILLPLVGALGGIALAEVIHEMAEIKRLSWDFGLESSPSDSAAAGTESSES